MAAKKRTRLTRLMAKLTFIAVFCISLSITFGTQRCWEYWFANPTLGESISLESET